MSFSTSGRMIAVSTLLLAASFANSMPISITQLEYEGLYARGPSCHPISLEQLQRLPAWNKVVKYAEDHWGAGGGPNVNPKEYPDRGVDACMDVSSVQAQWADQPTCEKASVAIDGKSSGNSQLSVTWQQQVGASATSSWSVTHATELTTGFEYSISAEVPGIAEISSKFSFSGTVRDERSSSFQSTNDMSISQTFEFKNDGGDKCKFNVDTTTCKATATARVPVVATGRVWFYYGESRKDKVTGGDDGHYHWNVDLASVLSEAERTSFIEIKGGVNAQSKSAYALDCDPINAAARTLARKTTSGGTKGVAAKGEPKDGKTATSSEAQTPKTKDPKTAVKPARAGKPNAQTPKGANGNAKPTTGKPSAPRKARRSVAYRRR